MSQIAESTSSHADEYVRQLHIVLAGMDEPQRTELTEMITAKLDAARSAEKPDHEVQRVIRLLGAPVRVARAAGYEPPRALHADNYQPAGPGAAEWVALVGLSIGSYVVPLVGWVLGAIVLWNSRRWTTSEKLYASALTVLEPILIVAAYTLDDTWVGFVPLVIGTVPAIYGCVFLYRRLAHPERLLAQSK